jgi:hypothetical protein
VLKKRRKRKKRRDYHSDVFFVSHTPIKFCVVDGCVNRLLHFGSGEIDRER